MLEIKDLHAEIDGEEILRGFNLTVPKGEVHAIMGPNGSGKSTLAYVLAGKEEYEVTDGSITWDGKICWPWSRTSARMPACSSPSNIRWKFRASPR